MQQLTSVSAARVLGISPKSLDNILNREARSLVGVGRRGRSRRIPVAGLEQIATALILRRDLEIPLARGLALANALTSQPGGELAFGSLGFLRFDVLRLRSALALATAQVLEEMVPPHRGRPTKSGPKTRRGAS